MEQAKELWTQYLNWITTHPQLATDVETSIKWITYIATGYLRDSQNSLLWTEVVFTFGDIFKFVNDRAYEQAFQTTRYVETDQIEKLLAFLDTAELLLEVGSNLVGGHTAKWIVVSTVQILKCSWRLIYLVKKRKLIRRPMVNQIDRESLKKSYQNSNVLSRSGRSMRSFRNDQSSTTSNRVWLTRQNTSERDFSTRLNDHQLIGEIFYILQPLVHLTSLGLFGAKSWTPWVLSSCCDILSQGFHYDTSNLTRDEQRELWRRRFSLLIYILRSPLYDIYTKRFIVGIFMIARPKIPFSSHISEFLSKYVPHYRKIYTYLWSR